jgi:hypothetical protein
MVEQTVTLEFPIDLEAVLSVNLNAENLKVTLKFLLDAINKANSEISGLKAQNLDLLARIETMGAGSGVPEELAAQV